MLAQRLRRWPKFKILLFQRKVLARLPSHHFDDLYQYSPTTYDLSYASDWSRRPSRPIRSLRYIVACTRIRVLPMLCCPQELGGGWFSLTMVNFSNPSGHGDNGNCCDSVTSSESTCRINPCDPYFLMCMGSEER